MKEKRMTIKDVYMQRDEICRLIEGVCGGTLRIKMNGCSFILSTIHNALRIYSEGTMTVSNGQPVHLMDIRRDRDDKLIHQHEIIKTLYKFLEENHGVTQSLNDLKCHKERCLSVISGGYL